jgi:hypothetical protein
MADYLIHDHRLSDQDGHFINFLAHAHAHRLRPRCLCTEPGTEMYVARWLDTFLLKRMPGSGEHHAVTCPSYELPADQTGMDRVLGTAIVEDIETGITTLKVDFRLSQGAPRSITPAAGQPSESVKASGSRLGLLGLLRYLWVEAELTRWHPGFEGKRNWAVVRKHLLDAARLKMLGCMPLIDRLWVPEPFSVERKGEINARINERLRQAATTHRGNRALLLLIGELKEIAPARYGDKAVIKHLPDHPLSLDAKLFRQVEGRFRDQLTLWGTCEDLHMLVIATLNAKTVGPPTIDELSLMPCTRDWLPVDDSEYEIRSSVGNVPTDRTGLATSRPPATPSPRCART